MYQQPSLTSQESQESQESKDFEKMTEEKEPPTPPMPSRDAVVVHQTLVSIDSLRRMKIKATQKESLTPPMPSRDAVVVQQPLVSIDSLRRMKAMGKGLHTSQKRAQDTMSFPSTVQNDVGHHVVEASSHIGRSSDTPTKDASVTKRVVTPELDSCQDGNHEDNNDGTYNDFNSDDGDDNESRINDTFSLFPYLNQEAASSPSNVDHHVDESLSSTEDNGDDRDNFEESSPQGEELVESFFQHISPFLMKPVQEPTGILYDFGKEEFKSYFEKHFELMTGMLSAYTPHWKVPVSVTELQAFIANKTTYHTNKCGYEVITRDFFGMFDETHFKFEQKGTPNGRYSIDVKATSKLYCYNDEFFLALDYFKESISGKKGMFEKQGCCTKLRTHFNPQDAVSTLKLKDKENAMDFISKHFKVCWDHQADTNQTNATLDDPSIIKIVNHMVNHEILKNGCVFLDCGSSYGSLLLHIVNLCKKQNVSIKGYGIEYAALRHNQGCKAMIRCMKDYMSTAWREDMDFNVENVNRNLLTYDKITNKDFNCVTGGSRIMFAFDRAFDGNLLTHIILVAVNSPDIDKFVTCRAYFETEQVQSRLATNSQRDEEGNYKGVTVKGFFHRKLLEHLGFVECCPETDVLYMNDKKDKGGKFQFYKVEGHETVDETFLDNLWKSFFKQNGMTEEAMNVLRDQWRGAENKKTSQHSCFPNTVQSVAPSIEKVIQYYKEEENISQVIVDDHDRKSKSKKRNSTQCSKFGFIMCSDVECVICRGRFPTEDKSRKFLMSRQTTYMEGEGLFATKSIKYGSCICEYYGERKEDDGQIGNYYAQIDNYTIVDAEKSHALARYANHSCSPNCTLQKIIKEKDPSTLVCTGKRKHDRQLKQKKEKDDITILWIIAKKDIKCGEEITIHYGDNYNKFFPHQKCLCEKCNATTSTKTITTRSSAGGEKFKKKRSSNKNKITVKRKR